MTTASDTPLAGQVVVFAGKLSLLGRRDAQAIVDRLGGVSATEVTAQTTMLVVAGEAEKGHQRRRAEAINRTSPGRVRILSEQDFCDLAALPSPDAWRQEHYTLRDVLGIYPGLREDHLRYLEKWGLVRTAVRSHGQAFYGFRDLGVIRQAHAELVRGVPFRAVLRSLAAESHGQLAFDFRPSRSDAQPAKVVELTSRPSAPSAPPPEDQEREAGTLAAVRYFMLGAGYDDGDVAKQEEAIASYRRALILDPNLVPALVNLANLHYARDALIEAQALYERAIALEPDSFEARFNLGNVHHDLGRYAAAEDAYRHASELNPGYADAHFYLAVTLEKLGRSQDAKPHWRTYQQLAPDGEWVELAREFSE